MGSGSFSASSYRSFTTATDHLPADKIFTSRAIHKDLDPKGVKLRESRDSADNPKSTPIIIAVDVTGSMGILAEKIAREGLGTVFNEILDQKPITDPHVMFMAIGDARSDAAPLQVSQFEADNRIVEQLVQIYIEGNGGGNGTESYDFAWWFAGNKTEHDSYTKRGKRGYLFTLGDEEAPDSLTRSHIKEFTGNEVERDVPSSESLADAQRLYDVIHIVIKQGNHCRTAFDTVKRSWTNLLGENVIYLDDYTKLAETIVACIETREGFAADKIKRFGGTVVSAVASLKPAKKVALLKN